MDFFLCRYDFHNLKALLKARMEEQEPQGLLEGLGTVGIGGIEEGGGQPCRRCPRLTRRRWRSWQGCPHRRSWIRWWKSTTWTTACSWPRREDSPFIIDFARASIDLANLKLVIRARLLSKEKGFLEAMMVEGGFVPAANLLDLYGDPPEVMAKKLEANLYYSQAAGDRGERG